MKAFVVITSFPNKGDEARKTLQQALKQSLRKAGDVVSLKDTDMRGFGCGNVMLIQEGSVTDWKENSLPILRLSLSIETSVSLDKTGAKTFPMIWSSNTFLQDKQESTEALQKLVEGFVQSYQYANKEQKPVFYFYD